MNQRPCPFCGAGALLIVEVEIRTFLVCKHCGATGPSGENPDDAIKLWNGDTSALGGSDFNLSDPFDGCLSPSDCAVTLGIKESEIKTLIRTNILHGFKLGKNYYIPKRAIAVFMGKLKTGSITLSRKEERL